MWNWLHTWFHKTRWLRAATLLLCACAASSHAAPPAQVMLLASYHAGMAWSDDQIAGVREQLRTQGDRVHVRLDLLDTKNVAASPALYQRIEDLLLTKYGPAAPQLMLAIDDDALDFALRMRQRHYPGVPILFSGVSGSRQSALTAEGNVSGVFDDVDIARTLDALLALRPPSGRLVVVHDQSRTSLAQVVGLHAYAAQHPKHAIEFLSQMDVQSIQTRLHTLAPQDLVLALAFNRDASNRVLSHEEATDLWTTASAAPVVVTRDVSMRAGVLGGFLITGRQQGEALGRMAVQVLQGTPASTLPMRDGVVQPLFDYTQLQRWNIAPERLPPNAIVLHRPPSSLESLRPHAPWLLALFGSLLVIIALLLNGIRVRRQSVRALRQSEQNYRQLFNSSTDAIVVRDAATGAIVEINPRFSALYGYTAEEALQLSASDLSLNVEPYTADQIARYMQQTRDGTPQLYEWPSRRKDGSTFWTQVSMTRFELPNGQRIVSTARDITELKTTQDSLQELNQQLEARVEARTHELQQALSQLVQSEKLAALGSLVAGVAHELNTPLGNTLMATTSLQETLTQFHQRVASGTVRRSDVTDTVDRLQEGCTLIERSTLRAAKLVNDFKQVAVDQSSAAQRHFLLRDVIDSVVTTTAPLFRPGQHRITVEIPPDIAMDSYPGPLEQILAHFLTNSLVHGFENRHAGEVRICAHGEHGSVVLAVTDNGCGISESNQKHVFEPFYTTRLGQGGSGLGLYVVHNLVTGVLGGRIALHSAPGSGTTVTLYLPLVAPATPQKLPTP